MQPQQLRRTHLIDLGRQTAPTVLLLHGLGSLAQEVAQPLAGGFIRAGYRVLAPDRPGYGQSDPVPANQMGPRAQAQSLAEMLKSLRVNVSLVVAHSFGAAVGLCLARRLMPTLRGMILINPFCRPTRPAAAPLMRLAVAPVVGPWIRRRLIQPMAAPIVRWQLANACAPDPPPATLRNLPPTLMTSDSALLGIAAELRGFNADVKWLAEDAKSLRTPIEVLTGSNDQVISAREHGDWLRQRLRYVDYKSVATGHMLHHTRPELVLEAAQKLQREWALA